MRERRASSDSLLRLLDTGKKMCLLPVGLAARLASVYWARATTHYEGAILAAATGATMSRCRLSS